MHDEPEDTDDAILRELGEMPLTGDDIDEDFDPLEARVDAEIRDCDELTDDEQLERVRYEPS